MKCIFTIDVEDWFHILNLPRTLTLSDWDSLPSCVERNFLRLLDVFAERDVRVTCFFLGWVAHKYPHLVKNAQERGNEVASHGYSHKVIYSMTSKEFLQDAVRSRKTLEDIVGKEIRGFRAPGFSVTADTPWFFENLIEAGYSYDSSVFPARHQHGGLNIRPFGPFLVWNVRRPFVEFPISVARIFKRPVCFFGGGYLRLFPLAVIERMALKVLREGRPVVLYVHPREIDPAHPRLPMGLKRRWMSYVNLGTTEGKIRGLISRFEFTTFDRFLDSENFNMLASTGPATPELNLPPFPTGS
jgi:polysaccharide deacetylase family protein (PEP-CTERM system associated)